MILLDEKYLSWLVAGERGISSETIYYVMTGIPVGGGRFCNPWDPSDFRRCHLLLECYPEWRARLPEVAERFPEWAGLVTEWDRLTELLIRDEPAGKSEEMYREMKRLTGRSA